MKEFVVIDPRGRLVDRIEPVEEDAIHQTELNWIVRTYNGSFRFRKREGYQYICREVKDGTKR